MPENMFPKEGNHFQTNAFGGEVFEAFRVEGDVIYANIVGVASSDGQFFEYNKQTLKEKKRISPKYFNATTQKLNVIEIEV